MAVDIKLKRSHTHSNIPTTSDLSEGEFAVNTYDGKMFMRDGSNNIVTVGSHYTTDFEPSTKTFYVTVATSAAGHVHHGSGSSNKYKINGVFSPFLKLIPGITYRFDQSDSSNSGHPFRFYLDENKSTAYTTGVTTNGTAGSSGAYTQIVVSHSTPSILHYQCSAHGLMGWAAFVNTHNLTAFDTGDLTEGSNLYFTNARVDSRLSSGSITGAIKTTGDMTADEYFVGGTTDHKIGKASHNYGDGIALTTDSATVTIGAGNSGYIHYMASGSQQHWFNQSVNTNAHFYVYSDQGSLTWLNNRGTSHEVILTTTTPTAQRTLSLPDQTGTLLSSGGDGSISGNLTLTSTDAGSSAAPIFDLVRDSSSPADADYLGQIRFRGYDDGGSQHTYAKITGKIQDASAGTEDGLIEFANVKAGSTTITARLRSDSLQLLNGTGLTVAGNTTLSGTLNGHTIPGGTGTLALTSDISASGIGNVVEDTTPQLGGDLDMNGNDITGAAGAKISLHSDGSNPTINIDGGGPNWIRFENNGNGNTNAVKIVYRTTPKDLRIERADNSNIMAEFGGDDGHVMLYHNNSERLETTSTSIQINNAYTLPAADGNANQVITTDGSGVLSFASVGSLAGSGIQNLSDDTSPQLGGNLDVVTHSIVSTSNRDINITPNGSGKVVLDGLSYPTADGSNGQVLTTDGSGTLTFADASGGGSGENVSWSVTQSSHGLAVGDVIYNNGTNYVKARANATGTLGIFVVSAVANANTFTATFSGKITLSSLTAGQYYFVSTSSAGDFTATEPTSGYSNPILFALSTTEAVVLPYRPQDLTAGGAAGARTALDVFSKAETNQQVSAFAIALG